MADVLRFLQDLPHRDIQELLREHDILKIFGVWCAVMASALLVGWLVQRRYRHGYFKRIGIPGPEADSVVFGNYMTVQKDPVAAIRKWTEEYGPVFGYYVGETPFVSISDTNLIREVFIKTVSSFSERPPFAMTVYPISQTLLCLSHEHWKKVRSVLTPAFSAAKLKLMMSLMNDSSTTLMKVVGEVADTGKRMCFFDMGQRLTLDVIARCALATKVNCLVDDKDYLFNAVREFLQNTETYAYHLAHGLPAIERLLTVVATYTSSTKMMNGLVENIRSVMSSRKKAGMKMEDMLQLLMDAADEDTAEGPMKIGDEDVAANAFLFLLAGYETTAITIANTSFNLAAYPEEQERLYEELCEVWPNSQEEITYEQVGKLKRLEAFILETLRVFPPVTQLVSRLTTQEITIGDYHIPKGVRMQAAVMEVHMDEKYWPEPQRFIPDRFIDTGASTQPHYLPFGIGPKMCIGKRFSLLELKVTFAHLLKSYRLVTPPELEGVTPPRKLVNISLVPEGGVPLHVEARQ